jgi:hypothetical protein
VPLEGACSALKDARVALSKKLTDLCQLAMLWEDAQVSDLESPQSMRQYLGSLHDLLLLVLCRFHLYLVSSPHGHAHGVTDENGPSDRLYPSSPHDTEDDGCSLWGWGRLALQCHEVKVKNKLKLGVFETWTEDYMRGSTFWFICPMAMSTPRQALRLSEYHFAYKHEIALLGQLGPLQGNGKLACMDHQLRCALQCANVYTAVSVMQDDPRSGLAWGFLVPSTRDPCIRSLAPFSTV